MPLAIPLSPIQLHPTNCVFMMKHCVIWWLHKNFSQHKKKSPLFIKHEEIFVSRIKSLLDVLKKQHKTHAMNWMELPANSINQLMKKSSRFFMFCKFYFACFSLNFFSMFFILTTWNEMWWWKIIRFLFFEGKFFFITFCKFHFAVTCTHMEKFLL